MPKVPKVENSGPRGNVKRNSKFDLQWIYNSKIAPQSGMYERIAKTEIEAIEFYKLYRNKLPPAYDLNLLKDGLPMNLDSDGD